MGMGWPDPHLAGVLQRFPWGPALQKRAPIAPDQILQLSRHLGWLLTGVSSSQSPVVHACPTETH